MGKIRDQRRGVVPGMAFFPGTGPHPYTCGDCDHFRPCGHSQSAGVCRKAEEMAPGRQVPAIDRDNAACKYLILNPQKDLR